MISFVGVYGSDVAREDMQRAQRDLDIAKAAFAEHVRLYPGVKLSRIESSKGVVDRRLYDALANDAIKPQYVVRKRLHNTVMEAEIEVNLARAQLDEALELEARERASGAGRNKKTRPVRSSNAFDAILAERSRAEKEDARFRATQESLERELAQASTMLAGSVPAAGLATLAPASSRYVDHGDFAEREAAYNARDKAALDGARKAIEASKKYIADYKPSAGLPPAGVPVEAEQAARRRSASPVRREASVMPDFPPSPKTTRLVKVDLGNLPELPPSPRSTGSDSDKE